MTAHWFETFDHTVHLTHEWINELDDMIGWGNRGQSFRLFRAVLHALRDWLQVNEAVDLGAQLPTLIRGVYYEHWRPAATPAKPRDVSTFIERVEEAFRPGELDDTERLIAVVFAFLSRKISDGEISDVKHALPSSVRELWTLERASL